MTTHREARAHALTQRIAYESGQTLAQIAATDGLSISAVWNRLKRAGAALRSRSHAADNAQHERNARILAAVRQTGNGSAVAKAFGLSKQRVSQIVKRDGGKA